jgi:hypothetical protein
LFPSRNRQTATDLSPPLASDRAFRKKRGLPLPPKQGQAPQTAPAITRQNKNAPQIRGVLGFTLR